MQRLYFCVAVVLLALGLAGCAGENLWSFRRQNVYSDDIQHYIEDRIDQEAKPLTGEERWSALQEHEFQVSRDFARDSDRLEYENKRRAEAEQLLDAGPLTLLDCMVYSLAFNNAIQASVAEIRSVGGERAIAKSRFLPTLSYSVSASVGENIRRNVLQSAFAGLTLLEFGKDNPIDVSLRALERERLFSHERTVALVLSAVRLNFFTIVLKKQQLAERHKLRAEFVARYERMRKLEEARRALEVDVLTAKLNVLNEDSRISRLEQEIMLLKLDLLHSMGLPMEMTHFDVRDESEIFSISSDDAIDIAFRRSTAIAQARTGVFEQDRVVRQLIWDYIPTVVARGGYRDDSGAVGLDLASDDGVYGASPFAERAFDQDNIDNFALDPTWGTNTNSGWRGGITLKLPILSGLARSGSFRREKALLDRNRHLLADVISDTERAVGKAHQDMLIQARQVEILGETVRISKERLRVQNRLKELGKITDNELETFRDRFFADQDAYFEGQLLLVQLQERLRLEMRYFDPASTEGNP